MSHKIAQRIQLLAFTFLVAVPAFLYTGRSDFSVVFGAAKTEKAGCTGDCELDSIDVPECLDADGCKYPDYCTNNELWFTSCSVGVPGPHDPKCFIDPDGDPNDWWRRGTTRRQACDPKKGKLTVFYDGGNAMAPVHCAWDGNVNVAAETPCKTDDCSTGPVVFIVTYAPAPKCAN